jgi:hypothetical protein
MFNTVLASFYLWNNRAFRVIHGGAQALFEGFWMGLLPEQAYDVISEKSYGSGKEYTNDRYLDQGLYFWEELAVRAWITPGDRVMVAAAGGGRELIGLTRIGFEAAGFDCSRAMVQAGQRALAARGMAATLEWSPPCMVPPMSGDFQAAIVGWNGYGYISPRSRRIAFLKSLRAQLPTGAPVLVSTAIRTPRARLAIWTPRIANVVRACTFRPRVFEPGDSFQGRPKMHFTRRQLESELAEGGFSPAASYMWGVNGAVVAKASPIEEDGSAD